MAPVSTLRPWKNGSNMDINELQEGTTIFIPIFLPGGLVWVGDSHCRQGNGEVNLTALECAYREIVMQLVVRKDLKQEWPRMETKTHWIMMGFDEDLNKAMVNATREAVDFLAAQKMVPLTRYEAYSLVSMVGDCRVTQVVDVRKGVHCMIPKSIFTSARSPRRDRGGHPRAAAGRARVGGCPGRPPGRHHLDRPEGAGRGGGRRAGPRREPGPPAPGSPRGRGEARPARAAARGRPPRPDRASTTSPGWPGSSARSAIRGSRRAPRTTWTPRRASSCSRSRSRASPPSAASMSTASATPITGSTPPTRGR